MVAEAMIIWFLGDGTGNGLNATQTATRTAVMRNGQADVSWGVATSHPLSRMRVKILKDLTKGLQNVRESVSNINLFMGRTWTS